MSRQQVVVVGAGMGGLVAALELAQHGLAVTVIDAGAGPGGKLRQLRVDGQDIDSGPTVFTMRWVFDELFDSLGLSLDQELRLQPLNVLARHWWDDGSAMDLYADPAQSFDAVGNLAGLDEARRFRDFCLQAHAVYRTLERPYIRQSAPTPWGLTRDVGWRGLQVLTGLGPLNSLWRNLSRRFNDERLRQLFARYATYTGSSPWQAPATLMLIAQVEMEGVWSVDGGMHALAACLQRLAVARGVQFRFETACEGIVLKGRRATGVRLTSGEQLDASAVVFAGDSAALRQGLLGEGARQAVPARAATRSLSALTWTLHTATAGVQLDRHNVFFQRRYADEFDDIFRRRQLPRTPTVYLCAQDRGVPGPVPEDGQPERLLCLVNAPAVGDQQTLTAEALEQCENNSFQLMRRCGLAMAPAGPQVLRTTPKHFHQRFPATGGALYGQASHGWMSAFARPRATTPLQGLFLAGGSVHPGPGVPMAALSGRLAAAALMASLVSTSSYPRAATSGGTSTRSATTANTA